MQYGAANPASSTPSSPQSTQAYAYDATGNRTSVTQAGAATSYYTNILNEYTAVGGVPESYDNNGNLATIVGYALGYDAQSRLTNTGSTSFTVAYDPLNRPVRRTSNGNTTYLFYDGWALISEFDGNTNKEIASYVHGGATDELLTCTNSGGMCYYHHDALGSTIALTNNGGQLVEQYVYDVFGQPTVKNAANVTIGSSTAE